MAQPGVAEEGAGPCFARAPGVEGPCIVSFCVAQLLMLLQKVLTGSLKALVHKLPQVASLLVREPPGPRGCSCVAGPQGCML